MFERLLSFVKERKVITQDELEEWHWKSKMSEADTSFFLNGLLNSKSVEKRSKIVVTEPHNLKPDLIFNPSDPLLKSHPMAPEVYYELKYAQKFPDILIPSYLKNILSLYDKLIELKDVKDSRGALRHHIALPIAMFLNCRGQHMCPVDLGRYIKTLPEGYYSKVSEIGEKVGEKFRYSPDELKDNALKMLETELGLSDSEFEQTFSKLYEIDRKERRNPVTRHYIGGLAYLASKMIGKKRSQKEIAQVFQSTESSIRENYKQVANLFGIEINRRGFVQPARLKWPEEYRTFYSNECDHVQKYWEEQVKKSFKSSELLSEIGKKDWSYDKLEDGLVAGAMSGIGKRYIPRRPTSTDFKKVQGFVKDAIKR